MSNPSRPSTHQAGKARIGGLARLSLAYKLPLLMAAVLVGTSVLSLAVSYGVLTRSTEAGARRRLLNAAHEVALSAADVIGQHAAELQEGAASPVVHALLQRIPGPGGVPVSVVALLDSLSLGPPVATVELRRPDGSLVLRAGPEPTTAPWPTGMDPLVRTTAMAEEGGEAYVWTVAPVTDAGTLLGWLGRRMKIGGTEGAVRVMGGLTGETVVMHLRNADGSLWSQHNGLVRPSPVRVSDTRTGATSYLWSDVGRVLAAESAVPDAPIVAVLQTPLHLVHARARETVSSLALTSLLIVLMGTLVAAVLGRQMTRPLVSVTRAAEAIAAGDYDRRVRVVGADESSRLASTFNQMAEEIKSARRELMARIEQAQQSKRDSDALRMVAEEARHLAEEANRAKSDFLAVMSHELRTPLNAIAGYTELLDIGIHGPVTDAQRDALQRISRNQAHLLTLIDDVLRYAQLEAGKVEFTLRAVPLDDALAELETVFEPQIRVAGLELVRRWGGDPELAVIADPDKLHQILLNLLSNAIKFTPQGGRITLSCRAEEERVHVTVEDTGIGIDAESLEAVFDPFFQGNRRTNRPASGVGLGLAISRDLARGMGGDLTVRSVLSFGAAFTVTLQRAFTDAVTADADDDVDREAVARGN